MSSRSVTGASKGEFPLEWIRDIRHDPQRFFEGFGFFKDEQTGLPRRERANVLQRRIFAHYRWCQERNAPCRMAVVKYRRAGSSTGSSCLMYVHSQNYKSRGAAVGTDYKSAQNMLQMVSHFASHDDFPGWSPKVKEAGFENVIWEAGNPVTKEIATRLEFATGSTIELFTAKNPESARSAGLNASHCTEVGRWPVGGEQDGARTISSVRNALPKSGFHLSIEESTASGAQGVFYETCLSARWPDDAPWSEQFSSLWLLSPVEFGQGLQYVFIFAAWFEDERHVPSEPLTAAQTAKIIATLDDHEKALIARFGQEGPRGMRLGAEVNATVWEQLAWRRGIIATVCTKGGADEFASEYPSHPSEAFRASGSPALDQEGMLALEVALRSAKPPESGTIDASGIFTPCPLNQADWLIWERPRHNCRYLVVCDPMSGAEAVTGTGEKDRHAVFIIRDEYMDEESGSFHRTKIVGRLKAPCQWEDELVSEALDAASKMYGQAIIVVEGNAGPAILKSLHTVYNANVFLREETDKTTQAVTRHLGWWTTAGTRRQAISALQTAVREQAIEIPCPHAVGELSSMVIDTKGKAVGGGSSHDDDALAIAIGLACIHQATRFIVRAPKIPVEPPDARSWKAM